MLGPVDEWRIAVGRARALALSAMSQRDIATKSTSPDERARRVESIARAPSPPVALSCGITPRNHSAAPTPAIATNATPAMIPAEDFFGGLVGQARIARRRDARRDRADPVRGIEGADSRPGSTAARTWLAPPHTTHSASGSDCANADGGDCGGERSSPP